MNQLQKAIGEWGKETFGNNQTVTGLKKHLEKELAELLSANNFNNEVEECADIVILLMGIAYLKGFDLLTEVEGKFEVIKERQWNEPDLDGVIQHKR